MNDQISMWSKLIAGALCLCLLLSGCVTEPADSSSEESAATSTESSGGTSVSENSVPDDSTSYPTEENADATLTWYSGDLKGSAELARNYLNGMLNADNNDIPYWGIHRTASRYAEANYTEDGVAHAVSRAIDCIYNIEAITGKPFDPAIKKKYVDCFLDCLSEELGMVYWTKGQQSLINCHTLRENAQALAWLATDDAYPQAKQWAENLLDTLEKVTDQEEYIFSQEVAAQNKLSQEFDGSLLGAYPQMSGRLVGGLMLIREKLGLAKAFAEAGWYTKSALTCFHDDGRFKKMAGTHVHSITSTLSGMLWYAIESNDTAAIDKLKKIYDHKEGLGGIMTSWGWIIEQINVNGANQGEVNQVGDIIQFQLLLADYENSAVWYSRAENFMRGMLLPSQTLNADFIREKTQPEGDFDTNMTQRVLGGWGFPMPTHHLESDTSPISTIDITQGAIQSIARFTQHIATRENNTTYVNLLFGWDNEVATVKSRLPLEGKLEVTPKQAGDLLVRIPANIQEDSLKVYIADKEVPYTLENGYMKLADAKAAEPVYIKFTPMFVTTTETVAYTGKTYTVCRLGEQVVEITPNKRGVYYLYEDFPLTIPQA